MIEIPDHPIGALDTPTSTSAIRSTSIRVQGWCIFPDGPIDTVDIYVDDHLVTRARTFIPRLDLNDVDHADTPFFGFEGHVPILEDSQTPFHVRVEATSVSGHLWRSEERLVLATLPVTRDPALSDLSRVRTERLLSPGESPGSRLVIVTHHLGLGGGQLWLQTLVRQMIDHVPAGIAVIAPHDGDLREELEKLGVEVYIVANPHKPSDAHFEGTVLGIGLLLEALSAGVVLVNTLGEYQAVVAASRLGIPVIWAIHESFSPEEFFWLTEPNAGELGSTFKRFKEALGGPRALVFEADRTSELFEGPSRADSRFRLDYGIEFEEIDAYRTTHDRSALREAEGFEPDETVILVLGTVEPRKAQSLVVSAFADVADVRPDIRLVLVGGFPNPYNDALEQQIERSRHADRIQLVPVTSDYFRWLMIADVFLSASDIESLPRSMLEAMAFDLPVISTDVFGVSTLLSDRISGWLTSERSLAALRGSLYSFLLLDPPERLAMAEQARIELLRRHVLTPYGERMAGAVNALLHDRDADLAGFFDSIQRDDDQELTMDNSEQSDLEPDNASGDESDLLHQRLKALRDENERLANRLLDAERVDAAHSEEVADLTTQVDASAERIAALERDLADHHRTLAYVLLTAGRKLRDRMSSGG